MKENNKVFLNKIILYVKFFVVHLVLLYTTISFSMFFLMANGFDIVYKGTDYFLNESNVEIYKESVVE